MEVRKEGNWLVVNPIKNVVRYLIALDSIIAVEKSTNECNTVPSIIIRTTKNDYTLEFYYDEEDNIFNDRWNRRNQAFDQKEPVNAIFAKLIKNKVIIVVEE